MKDYRTPIAYQSHTNRKTSQPDYSEHLPKIADAVQESNGAMQNDANACERMQVDANHADSVSVSVSVSVSIITNVENRS